MKFLKWTRIFLIVFLSLFVVYNCNAVGGVQDKIIIGTWHVNKAETEEYVLDALNAGFFNIDTASMYENEAEVGAAIRRYQEDHPMRQINVTTKFIIEDFPKKSDFTSDIKASLDEAIQKLGHVDEFLLHDVPIGVLDLGKFLVNIARGFRVLKGMPEYSKIKFGFSNVSFNDLEEVLKNEGVRPFVEVVQNPYWVGVEKSWLFFDPSGFLERGIRYETYKTLGHGLLISECGFSAAELVKHSIDLGFFPVVKARKEHLKELMQYGKARALSKKDKNLVDSTLSNNICGAGMGESA